MKFKKITARIVVLILALVVLVSGMPVSAMAAGQAEDGVITEVISGNKAAKIALNKKKVTLKSGSKTTLKLKNATAKKVTWKSSDKKIATVNSKGKVTAKTVKKKTKVTITAKYKKKTYKCVVTIVPKNSNTTINETVYQDDVKVEEFKDQKNYEVVNASDSNIGVRIPKTENIADITKNDVIILPDESGQPSMAVKVSNVSEDTNGYYVQGTKPDVTEVFEEIKISAKKTATDAYVDFNKELVTSVKGAKLDESITFGNGLEINVQDKVTKATGKITISAPTVNVDMDVDIDPGVFGVGKNVKINTAKITLDEVINANVDIEGEFSPDPKTLGRTTIPIGNGFSVDVIFYLKFGASGEAHIESSLTLTAGVDYNKSTKKFEPVRGLKPDFTGNAEANLELLISPTAQLRWLGVWISEDEVFGDIEVLKMSIDVGPAANATVEGNYSTEPKVCISIFVYGKLSLVVDEEYGIGGILNALGIKDLKWNIYTKNNSPLKKTFHVEDGERVDSCTRTNRKVPTYGTAAQLKFFNLNDYTYSVDKKNKTIRLSNYKSTAAGGKLFVPGLYKSKGEKNTKKGEDYRILLYRSMYASNQKVKSIELGMGVAVDATFKDGFRDLFANCSASEINVDGLDSTGITDMYAMFYRCKNLKSLDLSKLDMSEIKTMGNAFYGCTSLEKIVVSKDFNTKNIIDKGFAMFNLCKKLPDYATKTGNLGIEYAIPVSEGGFLEYK